MMPGRRKQVPAATISTHAGRRWQLCLFVRVTATGKTRLVGMLREPYSSRPRVGGGRAVPWKALNPEVAA